MIRPGQSGADKAEAKYVQQEGSPSGAFAVEEHFPEPDGKAEYEPPEHHEVGDLHPPLRAQAERADKLVPGNVAGARGPFNQEHDDEEQRTDCAAG
jgi:hypothetical protein